MHQRSIGKSQTHLTPRWIIERLGPFDLDPCAAQTRPWDCATTNYSEADDGLSRDWHGRVWMNPPFDRRVVGMWVSRLADHGCGTALVHARTDTRWFQTIWKRADALVFLPGRIRFFSTDGREQSENSGAPVMLAAFGMNDAVRLRKARFGGAFMSKQSRLVELTNRMSVE